LLDSYIKAKSVNGSTPEEIADAVGANAERADGTKNPRWMDDHFKKLMKDHKAEAKDWDDASRIRRAER
jgi:hypothetical protein